MSQLWLAAPPLWHRVTKWSRAAAELADRHYSRQTHGSDQVLPPGETLLLVTPERDAVWGVVHNLDPVGNRRWRCSIFRNEGGRRSSELVRAATNLTFAYWTHRYRRLPTVPLTTEVDPQKVRHKRDPGRCFLRAGWLRSETRRGLLVLFAPGETERIKPEAASE